MNYALIKDGVVINIIWLHPSNAHDFQNAVPIGEVPVDVGDTYENGVFYREGKQVLTASEEARLEKKDMKAALALLGVKVE